MSQADRVKDRFHGMSLVPDESMQCCRDESSEIWAWWGADDGKGRICRYWATSYIHLCV